MKSQVKVFPVAGSIVDELHPDGEFSCDAIDLITVLGHVSAELHPFKGGWTVMLDGESIAMIRPAYENMIDNVTPVLEFDFNVEKETK